MEEWPGRGSTLSRRSWWRMLRGP